MTDNNIENLYGLKGIKINNNSNSYLLIISVLDNLGKYYNSRVDVIKKSKNLEYINDIKNFNDIIKVLIRFMNKLKNNYDNITLKISKKVNIYIKIDADLAKHLKLDVKNVYNKGDIERKFKDLLKSNGNMISVDENNDNKSNSHIKFIIYNSSKKGKEGESYNKYSVLLPNKPDISKYKDGINNKYYQEDLKHFEKWSKEAKDKLEIYSINIINTIKHHIIELSERDNIYANYDNNEEIDVLCNKLCITKDEWKKYMLKHIKMSEDEKLEESEKNNSEKKEKKVPKKEKKQKEIEEPLKI